MPYSFLSFLPLNQGFSMTLDIGWQPASSVVSLGIGSSWGCLHASQRLELGSLKLQQHVLLSRATSGATQPHSELSRYRSHYKRYSKNSLALTDFFLFLSLIP